MPQFKRRSLFCHISCVAVAYHLIVLLFRDLPVIVCNPCSSWALSPAHQSSGCYGRLHDSEFKQYTVVLLSLDQKLSW